ncbi:NUDIX domain-containing protein [Alkalibacillus silvisoli]|uniref:Nudix hydrolase domain-containing protein n=1 Tax=Alkalibacillus silvisoli TaxID=392823 RepID=A0ABP3JHQ3_9BACI
MILKQFAAAFLFNEEDEVLLLQKKRDAKLLAGMRVPIGGHMETSEMNNPEAACFREIAEETGISPKEVQDLSLRYIVQRMKGDQIYIQYIFFGYIQSDVKLVESDEGKLNWVHYKQVKEQPVTEATRELVKHYEQVGQFDHNIYVGSMSLQSNLPKMTWALLDDW